MSDFSLTLVLQIKTSKIVIDMAKVSIKSEKITAFGGSTNLIRIFDTDFLYPRCPAKHLFVPPIGLYYMGSGHNAFAKIQKISVILL